MNTLTDREKALLEAARNLVESGVFFPVDEYTAGVRLIMETQAALRAYDPPKEKVYVLPTWGDLRAVAIKGDDVSMLIQSDKGVAWVGRADYEVLREATAKEQE